MLLKKQTVEDVYVIESGRKSCLAVETRLILIVQIICFNSKPAPKFGVLMFALNASYCKA
jgi:hypothetical protein